MRKKTSVKLVTVLVLALFLVGLPAQVCADPVWTVFRDTIGGSLAGLLVGIAIDVAREGDDADGTRVCFIAGTFAGLGLGIYQATKESKQKDQSLLNIESGKGVSLCLALPEVTLQCQTDPVGGRSSEVAYNLRMIGVSF